MFRVGIFLLFFSTSAHAQGALEAIGALDAVLTDLMTSSPKLAALVVSEVNAVRGTLGLSGAVVLSPGGSNIITVATPTAAELTLQVIHKNHPNIFTKNLLGDQYAVVNRIITTNPTYATEYTSINTSVPKFETGNSTGMPIFSDNSSNWSTTVSELEAAKAKYPAYSTSITKILDNASAIRHDLGLTVISQGSCIAKGNVSATSVEVFEDFTTTLRQNIPRIREEANRSRSSSCPAKLGATTFMTSTMRDALKFPIYADAEANGIYLIQHCGGGSPQFIPTIQAAKSFGELPTKCE